METIIIVMLTVALVGYIICDKYLDYNKGYDDGFHDAFDENRKYREMMDFLEKFRAHHGGHHGE